MPPEKRTLREISKEIVAHPFLPLLFIAEAIKEGAVTFTEIEPVVAYSILAGVATGVWVLSDVPKEEIIGNKNE